MSNQVLQSAQKQHLLKSFKLLKSHACKVANFTLQWNDLEDHLRFIHSQIESKLQLLQNTVKNDTNPLDKELVSTQNEKNPESEINSKETTETKNASSAPVKNGKGLLLYVKQHGKDVGNRLFNLFKVVDDPGKLVLEALQEFYPPDFGKGEVVSSEIRRNCVVLLEEFGRVSEKVEPQVREEAMRLAVEWKDRVENSLEVLGFLQLLIGFGLVEEFACDEILKLFDNVVMHREAPELFRALGFADKASEIVQKLIKKDRQLEAIRFIYEFDLVNQFPPVPLLRAHAKYAKKVAKRIRKKGNNSPKAQDDATKSEIAALRGIIRYIETYQLGSEYSSKMLRNHIQQLKRQRKESKTGANATVFNAQSQKQKGNKRTTLMPKAQQNQQNMNKRQRTAAPNVSVKANHPEQSSNRQPANLFSGQGAQYSTPSAGIDAPSNATPYAYVSAASNIQSIQPSRDQPSGLLTGAQCLVPSFGKYHSANLDAQPSAAIDTLQKSTSYPYVDAASYGHSMHGPLGQSADLLTGAQHLTPSLRNYLSTSSTPVTSYTSLAARPYGLVSSASVHPHMSKSPGLYETTIAANAISGQFALARTHTPISIASHANTNPSVPLYHADLLGTSIYYNRQPSSSRRGMAPNTSPNTSGYYDRPLMTSGNYGVSSKYSPSIYHP